MNDSDPGEESGVPQLRTLLLTDLCDSTAMVERLGDGAAADLFREHDRLVLELQQRWRGRLIDRSDGLLLLFERPIDGLGFALDYVRGLRTIGENRMLTLQARSGLHVGEVLTWRNSDEAVQVGAKPLEVEGLAKPMAGRLMTLARAGQILMSSTAEPLMHRSARELGERGEHLLWKSYGRWRFKGVPNGQEVFEVGEPGFAPLRAPKNGAKAWRDIPLWRRPAALAAEVLLVIGIGTGAWFVTRPQPAIAFNERDWVVVGDLRNLTGQPVLDESLEQAFRISLEQSRFVNVLSDLKVRDTLALMKRKPGTLLDRAIASEVALRDGARAVILPTVAEIGGRVRVSAEVIDPHSQTTVYAESADGVGVGSTLASIDDVTGALRNKLGEAIKSIEQDSAPLPKVSTSNLDALKAYALGKQRYYSGETKKALAFFQRAIDLDPQFALAIMAAGQAHGVLGDLPSARRELNRASKLRSRLSGREVLLLDADIGRFGPVTQRLERWQQLIDMYPDSHQAHLSLAQDGMFYANRYASGLAHARAAAAPQFGGQSTANYLHGMILLGLERYADAIKMFEASRRLGFKGAGFSYAYAYAAQRDYAGAERALRTRLNTGAATAELEAKYSQMLFALDRGRWSTMLSSARDGLESASQVEPLMAGAEWRNRVLTVEFLAGHEQKPRLESRLLREIATIQTNAVMTDDVYPSYSEMLLLSAGDLGGRLDALPLVERALDAVQHSNDMVGYPILLQMQQVLLAERERLSGKPEAAVARLSKLVGSEEALVAMHSALSRAARASGNEAIELRELNWLTSHRGRAYAEHGANHLQTPLNIADTTLARLSAAELLTQLGRESDARKELAAFLGAWPVQDLPEGLRLRVRRLQVNRTGVLEGK
ncbi:MAG: putative peptide modification system cyclase [Lysobacter sp.]|nr:putative peptide modification system cyclase [Lysobacter sp.]